MLALGALRAKGWWARPDLNRGPSDYESPALTAELRARKTDFIGGFLFRPVKICFFHVVCAKTRQTENEKSRRQKTPVANLFRNATSRIYYAGVRVQGKLIWKSLDLILRLGEKAGASMLVKICAPMAQMDRAAVF
jgi:hypothetical protein